ncbi:MAG: DUF2071 domain-containing protein [Myxococcota bacterium]
MRIPAITGVIERRILANYRIDPDVLTKALPAPFRPQLHEGVAVGGICLIRLRAIRPRWMPWAIGLSSENAAHRFAVEWDTDQGVQQGVYIPRRDTSSRANALVGGRLFPGVHHHADFEVNESEARYSVAMTADDGTHVRVAGTVAETLPEDSVFASVGDASTFFEKGCLGYSDTRTPGTYDGLELRTLAWKVTPLSVEDTASSFFADRARFPEGSVELDCALLMRDIPHEWHGRAAIRAP